MSKIYIDIDETICYYADSNNRNYALALPVINNIKKVNKLYDQGYQITLWTARGTVTGLDWRSTTEGQLQQWGVKYHQLLFGKPDYDLLIDDKVLNSLIHWKESLVDQLLKTDHSSYYQSAKICALIPARYGSSRLEGKPLLKIGSQSIIQRTYLQTIKSKYLEPENVYVVTDDTRIVQSIQAVQGQTLMVTESCLNGTERVCRALDQIDQQYQLIINVQGDEPFINPEHIDHLIEQHLNFRYQDQLVCTTLHTPLDSHDDPHDRTIGKMVLDNRHNVLWCSRTPIPATKQALVDPKYQYQIHIGLFLFERFFLEKYLSLPNTSAQLSEDIEWLKIIESGYGLKSFSVDSSERGVNTKEDYLYLVRKYSQKESVLYVTSFNQELYEATGQRLIRSFLETKTEGMLLICSEQMQSSGKSGEQGEQKQDLQWLTTSNRIIHYSLDGDRLLQQWLDLNYQYIPDYLGGQVTAEVYEQWNVWQRKASLWARKIFALKYARDHYSHFYETLIWIDCDCYFLQQLPVSLINKVFHHDLFQIDGHVFYYQGSVRSVPEAGLMGFHQEHGYQLIDQATQYLRDQSYVQDPRWDDAYIWMKIMNQNPQVMTVDLALGSIIHDVMTEGPFESYIKHEKGTHAHRSVGLGNKYDSYVQTVNASRQNSSPQTKKTEFDWQFYIDFYPDLKSAGINTEQKARKHWLNYGIKEGRLGNKDAVTTVKRNIGTKEDFNWQSYIKKNPDLRRKGIYTLDKAWRHWSTIGYKEKRKI